MPYCDLIRGANNSGYHVDGSIGRIYPDAVAVVVATRVRIHPGRPTERDRIDNDRISRIVFTKLESENVGLNRIGCADEFR